MKEDNKHIYFLRGVRHQIFVKAKSPEHAYKVGFASKKIYDWECPSVHEAMWKNNVLVCGKLIRQWIESGDLI
jgi:hypothetical protein